MLFNAFLLFWSQKLQKQGICGHWSCRERITLCERKSKNGEKEAGHHCCEVHSVFEKIGRPPYLLYKVPSLCGVEKGFEG